MSNIDLNSINRLKTPEEMAEFAALSCSKEDIALLEEAAEAAALLAEKKAKQAMKAEKQAAKLAKFLKKAKKQAKLQAEEAMLEELREAKASKEEAETAEVKTEAVEADQAESIEVKAEAAEVIVADGKENPTEDGRRKQADAEEKTQKVEIPADISQRMDDVDMDEADEKLPEGPQEMAISVKDLVISYKTVQSYSIKQSLLRMKKADTSTFRAVKGVSFEVPKGQILGITGKNGSGKSTMLRALAGIFSADSGTIDLHDHSVSLLSIGVGFQNKLSGRENILLSGMVLGFSEEVVRSKMKEIIEFSELGAFIDRPVRTYSSGMYSKLAFSITAILETEIILIDEVLSVGDERFKKKSFEKMKSLISNRDRTVVIVSHSMSMLEALCDRVMWMHEGEIKMIGEPKEVIPAYKEFMK